MQPNSQNQVITALNRIPFGQEGAAAKQALFNLSTRNNGEGLVVCNWLQGLFFNISQGIPVLDNQPQQPAPQAMQPMQPQPLDPFAAPAQITAPVLTPMLPGQYAPPVDEAYEGQIGTHANPVVAGGLPPNHPHAIDQALAQAPVAGVVPVAPPYVEKVLPPEPAGPVNNPIHQPQPGAQALPIPPLPTLPQMPNFEAMEMPALREVATLWGVKVSGPMKEPTLRKKLTDLYTGRMTFSEQIQQQPAQGA